MENNLDIKNIDKLIKLAFEEDIKDIGDGTSDAIFQNQKDWYYLIAKDKGILCGKDFFEKSFFFIDNKIKIDFFFNDGDTIKYGDKIAKIEGKVQSLLKAERTALNFLSHLSAISTKTNLFVKKSDNKLKILDTRKTIPGLRELQKYAVKTGGGENHRMGLYDMVMIKDNHIDAAGSITNAVTLVRKKWANKYKIEVETRNMKEIQEALDNKADRIMLDNMSNELMSDAVKLIGNKAETEASGNMTIDRIEDLAKIGINYISFGELTHTVKVFDFSFKKL